MSAQNTSGQEGTMEMPTRGPAAGLYCAAPDARRSQDSGGLPDGFVAVRKIKSLALMGRWPPLPDHMPAWLPFQCMVDMARRHDAGDPQAQAWLELYRRAVHGDRDAQREMGRASEHGAWESEIDLQRAFFWYYRAGLAGDEEASDDALRLKERHEIVPAAMEEPALVYPGRWRITRDDLDGALSAQVLELAEDHTYSTRGTQGTWSYDAARTTLTLQHDEIWRIRVLGCRETTLFGRDQRLVTYVIERAAPCFPHTGQ
jgi:TPR repeat protein